MTLAQIKNLINSCLGTTGQESGSLDDFSWVDTGTAIANLSAADFKTFLQKFALGVVKTDFDTRVWEYTLDLFTDWQTYEGIKQYIKAAPLTADDVTMMALVGGVDYDDRVYKDLTTSTTLYTKDFGYQFSWCVPQEELKYLFSDEESVVNYVGLINATVSTSFNRAKWNTQLSIIAKVAVDAVAASKKIDLATAYNNTHSTPVTVGEAALESDDFKRWSRETIANLRRFMMDITSKYNSNAAESFTPYEDTRVTLLTQFANSLQNVPAWGDLGDKLAIGKYSTVNMWQASGSAILPTIATTGAISDANGGGTPITATNVVGLLYDRYTCGCTLKTDKKITSDYVPKGDFTKFFGAMAGQAFINNNNNAIVLTLN